MSPNSDPFAPEAAVRSEPLSSSQLCRTKDKGIVRKAMVKKVTAVKGRRAGAKEYSDAEKLFLACRGVDRHKTRTV